MRLKIDPGETATVELTTRPHSSGHVRLVDEHGRQLGAIVVSSDAGEIRLTFETPWGYPARARVPSYESDATLVTTIPHPRAR